MAGPLLGVVPLAARLPLLRPLGCEMLSQLWGQTVPSRLLPCSSLPFERPVGYRRRGDRDGETESRRGEEVQKVKGQRKD